MKRDDFPALYRAADDASNRAQAALIHGLRWTTLLTVIGAVVSSIGVTDRTTAALAAASFLVALALTGLAKYLGWERRWYRARAIAESVKTSSWRFIMRAEPFNGAADSSQARNAFRTVLIEILKRHENLARDLGGSPSIEQALPQSMNDFRALSLGERKELYCVFQRS